MINNLFMTNFLRNVAKDCKFAADGSMVESRLDAHITDACTLADHDFDDRLDNIAEMVSDKQKEDIYNAAMKMLTEHELASFTDGFLYALTLACAED